jgi:DNA oxidative demethylase
MMTPGGFHMSVAMTNCGDYGWVSDRTGYRYDASDPVSKQPWPSLPAVFLTLASAAAARGGFINFTPDACLINRYAPGTKLSLHQDRDERDFDAPIVSVSLGHGDVVVWGGTARRYFHGVATLKENHHPLTGDRRVNLTFRKAR